ncbi:MAG: PKD domain-containing protein, partial [Taibaiella sp.]|nr:PKD domain-containing protein [Taibaiella sp.]
MRNRILFLIFCLFLTGKGFAQLVGTDCFLQGQWLEVGVNTMGGFGTCTSPLTYHPHVCCGTVTAFTPGGNLDAAYDWGHDGWSVGSPQLMGNYSIPGYPQEGWSVQVGATEYRNGAWGGICTGAFAIPGGHTGYTNTGGRAIEYWSGNVAGLNIRHETRLDTYASWVVITAVLRNTTGAPIANIYYQRTLDPDNTSFWSGTPVTRNRIVHQNEDARHRVMVSANGETAASGSTPAYNATNSYLALATKDCRAKACVISGLSPSNTPSTIWSAIPIAPSGPVVLGALGATNYNDQGISLIYNLGTIAGGDSAIISYAYIYNGNNGIDSAFPDPQIVINGVPKVSYAPPIPNYDTFVACESGLTTLPVSFLYAEDKCWSWSHWTWAPGTGLASTTGVNNTITLAGLPPVITYTITGTDSGAHMFSCNTKIFYLTIVSCNGAESNEPCVGDTLVLNAPGDSLGATYKWYGPFPSTTVISTAQKHLHFPATMADTGVYSVIKTIAGIPDTSTTHVRIIPLPVISVTTSQPYCQPAVSPMTLTCTADSILVSYAWSGPAGYTSTAISPSINPFDSSMGGIYTVTVENTYGCKQTGSVEVKPGPLANFNFVQLPGCPNDSATFTDASINGAGYAWNFGDGTSSFDKNPPLHIYTAGHKVYTVTLTVTSANGCVDAETKTVDLQHTVTADFNTTMAIKDTVCNGDPIVIGDLSDATKYGAANTPLASYEWEWTGGAGYTETTNAFPVSHTYPNEGIYQVTLKVTDNLGCEATKTKTMVVLQPYITGVSDTTFCLVRPFAMENVIWLAPKPITFDGYGYTYSWSGDISKLSSSTVKVPTFNAIGQYTYTLTATLNRHGCPATHVMTLNSILPTPLTNISADAAIKLGGSYQLSADSNFVYTWTPNDGSLDNPNINNPI